MTHDLEFDVTGDGAPFVMLHPGGTDSRSLDPLVSELPGYRIWRPDRRGHGRTPDAEGAMTFESMADDTVAFLHEEVGEPVHLFGFSDGGIVALLVALRAPETVIDVAIGGAVFHHSGWGAGVLDEDDGWPDFMVDAYAEVSPDGRDHFPVVARKMAAMHATGPTLTTDDLSTIDLPALVFVGDDDEPTLEHTIQFFRALPRGELAVIPHASHGVIVEKPALLAVLLREFHRLDKPSTVAPRRRA